MSGVRHTTEIGNHGLAVRWVDESFATAAVAILREATAWAGTRGTQVWKDADLRERDFEAAARAHQLVMGFSGDHPAATMLIQSSDPLYWPEVAAGSSLFLHKIGVSRQFAGRGWLQRLVDFAVVIAQERGCGWLRLDTLHGTRLRELYEGQGFALVEEAPLVIQDRLMIRMQRPV
jgi:ribosomal protein S18 acetylase RimI-like enzyme